MSYAVIFYFIFWLKLAFVSFNSCKISKPLKLKVNESTTQRLEEIFDRNPLDNIAYVRKLFEDAKQEAIEDVNQQLKRIRDLNQMGKSSLA